jgi:hypothetical protein
MKGLIVQSMDNDTTEKDKNLCYLVGPQAAFRIAGPGNLYRLTARLVGTGTGQLYLISFFLFSFPFLPFIYFFDRAVVPVSACFNITQHI